MTTNLRLWLVAFIIGWVLSSAGYGQCAGRICRSASRGNAVAPLALAPPRPIAQAPSPQFEPPPMSAPPMPMSPPAASSPTIVQHPPVVVSVEPPPTIHVRSPQVIVQYQSGPAPPPQASFAPPQASFAPPMPSKTLPAPQTIQVQGLGVTVIRPVYRPGTRIVIKPTRRHLHWLD